MTSRRFGAGSWKAELCLCPPDKPIRLSLPRGWDQNSGDMDKSRYSQALIPSCWSHPAWTGRKESLSDFKVKPRENELADPRGLINKAEVEVRRDHRELGTCRGSSMYWDQSS